MKERKGAESERRTSRRVLVALGMLDRLFVDSRSISKKAEIGFTYDDAPASSRRTTVAEESDDDDDDDDEDLDLDIEIDISQLTSDNKASLNKVATHYGMPLGDFARMLILDREEMQQIRENKLEREHEMPVKVRIQCSPKSTSIRFTPRVGELDENVV